LQISHLNNEGISASTSDYLSRLMIEYEIDIVAIQETHTNSDLNLLNRGKLPGFKLIGAIHSNVHGIATYVRDTLADCFLTHKEFSNNIHVIAVEVNGGTVVNVYKPSSFNWSSNTLKIFRHPTIYVGDFNFYNQLWGYEHNNADGSRLSYIQPEGQRNVPIGQMDERLFSRPFNDNSRSCR
jgi:exonuclease III